jgi:hypothetical protein
MRSRLLRSCAYSKHADASATPLATQLGYGTIATRMKAKALSEDAPVMATNSAIWACSAGVGVAMGR